MAFNPQQMMQNMRQRRQQMRGDGGLTQGGFGSRPGGPVNTLPMPGAQPVAQPPMFPTGANPYNPNPYAGGANPYGPQPGVPSYAAQTGLPPPGGSLNYGGVMAGQPPQFGTQAPGMPMKPEPQVQQPYNPYGAYGQVLIFAIFPFGCVARA